MCCTARQPTSPSSARWGSTSFPSTLRPASSVLGLTLTTAQNCFSSPRMRVKLNLTHDNLDKNMISWFQGIPLVEPTVSRLTTIYVSCFDAPKTSSCCSSNFLCTVIYHFDTSSFCVLAKPANQQPVEAAVNKCNSNTQVSSGEMWLRSLEGNNWWRKSIGGEKHQTINLTTSLLHLL